MIDMKMSERVIERARKREKKHEIRIEGKIEKKNRLTVESVCMKKIRNKILK